VEGCFVQAVLNKLYSSVCSTSLVQTSVLFPKHITGAYKLMISKCVQCVWIFEHAHCAVVCQVSWECRRKSLGPTNLPTKMNSTIVQIPRRYGGAHSA